MGLLLNSFKLTEQKFIGIDKVWSITFLKECFILFFCEVVVNSVIDGKPFDSIDVFNELETHGTSDSSIPEIRK